MKRSPKQTRRTKRERSGPVRVPAHPHDPDALRLYRPSRLAALFDVDQSTIWRWRKDGTLPPFTQVGGISGLTEEQVAEVIERNRRAD